MENENKTYYLMWTYLGNHSDKPMRVEALSPEVAVNCLLEFFSDDFRAKGTIQVFDHEPVHTYKGPKAR